MTKSKPKPSSNKKKMSNNINSGNSSSKIQSSVVKTSINIEQTSNGGLRISHEGEHQRDFGHTPIYFTKATRTYTFCAALHSCNLGYDIGISNSSGEMIQEELSLSNAERDVLIGSLHFWSIFGALAAHYISDTHGRRRTFLISAISILIGVTIIAASSAYGMLMFGRIFIGLGLGCGLAISPMYISEVSPAKGRGEMVNWTEIGLNIGLMFGFSSGLFLSKLSDATEWRIMFILGGALPALMIYLAVFVMPESPRWLIAQNRRAEARALFKRLYNLRINVDHVVDNIKESLMRDRLAFSRFTGWGVFIQPTPAVARMLLIGIALAIAQQAVGVDAVQHYMLDALRETGIESEHLRSELMILLSLVKIMFIMVGGKASDIGGRRRQLFVSLVGMALSLLVLAAVFYSTSYLNPRLTVFGLSLYLSFYSLGMGPGSWLVPSEIFPTSIRAKAMSLVAGANRAAATIMASTFVFSNWLSWTTFYLVFAIVCMGVTIFIYIFLPETKGRNVDDMSLYFAEITSDEAILTAERRIQGEVQPTSTSVEISSAVEPLVAGSVSPSLI